MTNTNPEHIAAARANLSRVWQETQEYAKQNGLVYFLDKPQELNNAIIKMIKLSNDMQLAEQRHQYKEEHVGKEKISGYVGKYAEGKFILCFTGNGKYDEHAKRAFSGAVDVYAILNRDDFIQSMKRQNVPEDTILEYLRDYHILDECFARETKL